MERILNPGRTKYGSLYINVIIKDKGGVNVLSITGVEGPKHNGDCVGGAGQCLDALLDIREFNPGWDSIMAHNLYAIWDAWHLNDMRSGCEHQRAMGWNSDWLIDPEANRIQQNMMMWNGVENGGLLSRPCPICGYKFGTKWLHEEVPKWVLDWLMGLPETTVKPAWI